MGRRWEAGCWAGATGRGATEGPGEELRVESDAKAVLEAELQVGPARQGEGVGTGGGGVVG